MITASAYGRLGRDPERRETRKGSAMTTASLAVDVTPYGVEDTVTTWISIAAFGSAAESLAQHAKGDCIGVVGKLTLRQWTGRDGEQRESWQMTADSLHSSRTVRPGGKRKRESAEHGEPETETAGAEPGLDDDIPF